MFFNDDSLIGNLLSIGIGLFVANHMANQSYEIDRRKLHAEFNQLEIERLKAENERLKRGLN